MVSGLLGSLVPPRLSGLVPRPEDEEIGELVTQVLGVERLTGK